MYSSPPLVVVVEYTRDSVIGGFARASSAVLGALPASGCCAWRVVEDWHYRSMDRFGFAWGI